jgi:DNA-binding response OmpR family regulator
MRVLVVEDHEDTAETVSLLLQLAGYEVEVAPDGEAAVAAVRANPPDVVLLDIGLPGIDGWQVARQVQEVPAEKKPLLVAVSGRDSAEARRRSEEAGIDLHLAKPVDPWQLRQLLARFRQIIEQPQQSV